MIYYESNTQIWEKVMHPGNDNCTYNYVLWLETTKYKARVNGNYRIRLFLPPS